MMAVWREVAGYRFLVSVRSGTRLRARYLAFAGRERHVLRNYMLFYHLAPVKLAALWIRLLTLSFVDGNCI